MPENDQPSGSERTALRADCANCFGLCCVALTLTRSADFAFSKESGKPCRHLRADFRCGIHAGLRAEGCPGCTVYDCFGAGQKVSRDTYRGRDWRSAPQTARQMFRVFTLMRQLHELLWYLTEAKTLSAARPLRAEIGAALDETEALTRLPAGSLADLDVAAHRDGVAALLRRVSELARASAPRGKRRNHRGADLIGAKMRGADLRGADLRGTCLVAAELKGADLRLADLIGADLRDADLSGADLTTSLFLTQSQINAAKGDGTAKLPASLARPGHWTV